MKDDITTNISNEAESPAFLVAAGNCSLREKSLQWFFAKSETDKSYLKDKYFNSTPIQHSSQWGYHFTFGQIEEMYVKER